MTHKIELFPTTKALIFDLDGTLANSMPLHLAAWEKAAKHFNLKYSYDFLLSCAGMPSTKIIEIMNQKNNSDINPEEFRLMKEQIFLENMHKVQPINAVVDLVYQYHNKMPMAIGTGGQKQIATDTVKLLGLDKYISILVSADDVEKHKPNPDTFLQCAKIMGVKPENCQVFEDAVLGFEAAENAGMKFTDVRPFY